MYNGVSADALPYADLNGSGTLLTRYVSGPGMVNGAAVDELLARTSSGGTSAWYLSDKLDSVRDVVNSSGSVIDHVVYDNFGNIVTETSVSNGDRFKYAGMEYDLTTGQYYDRARFYDNLVGRFMELDPSGFSAGDANLYRYASNSPANMGDYSGLQEDEPQNTTNQEQKAAQTNLALSKADLLILEFLRTLAQAHQQAAANAIEDVKDDIIMLELLKRTIQDKVDQGVAQILIDKKTKKLLELEVERALWEALAQKIADAKLPAPPARRSRRNRHNFKRGVDCGSSLGAHRTAASKMGSATGTDWFLDGTEQKIGASFDHLAGATRAVADLRDSLFMAHL